MSIDDEEDQLACRLEVMSGAVLSEKGHESTLKQLILQMPAGEWMSLRGSLSTDFQEDVFVAWLNLPDESDRSFRLILFLHEESGWSMTANYNVERLLGPSC